jgi:hypothetical protein
MIKNSRFTLVFALLSVLSANVMAQQAPFIIGLKLKDFVAAFNRHAKFDDERMLELRTCKESPVPSDKNLRTFLCKTDGFVFIDGVLQASGQIQDVTVNGRPQNTAELHQFRRAATYAARAVKNLPGEGVLVGELLSPAAKSPGKAATKIDSGILFSAINDPQFGWSFSVERPR